jgi:hypothetical protein
MTNTDGVTFVIRVGNQRKRVQKLNRSACGETGFWKLIIFRAVSDWWKIQMSGTFYQNFVVTLSLQ